MRRFSCLKIALVLSFLAICFASAASAQTVYTITDLGTFSGGSFSIGQGINASGQVTGASASVYYHAFLYSRGTMTDLGTLGGNFDWGYGINATGQVTGYSFLPGGNVYHAFLYSGGTMSDLGTLGGAYSVGSGINNSGQVTGYSLTTGNNAYHTFLYSDGTMTDLGTLGGSFSLGSSINNSGQVTGDSYKTGDGVYHAFLYSGGVMTDLGTLGGVNSVGSGINDSGQVTGYSYLLGGSVYHAFLYSGGVMTDLGTLGGINSTGSGINSSGQVTGNSFTTGNSAVHAFLYTPGKGMIDLNASLPNGSGWTLLNALAVNDYGKITGQGINPNGDSHAFLLSPVRTIKDLTNLIESFNLPYGIAHSLLAKLHAAKDSGPDGARCDDLNSFIMEVQSQSGKKLTTGQAIQLIAAANQVKAAHNCRLCSTDSPECRAPRGLHDKDLSPFDEP